MYEYTICSVVCSPAGRFWRSCEHNSSATNHSQTWPLPGHLSLTQYGHPRIRHSICVYDGRTAQHSTELMSNCYFDWVWACGWYGARPQGRHVFRSFVIRPACLRFRAHAHAPLMIIVSCVCVYVCVLVSWLSVCVFVKELGFQYFTIEPIAKTCVWMHDTNNCHCPFSCVYSQHTFFNAFVEAAMWATSQTQIHMYVTCGKVIFPQTCGEHVRLSALCDEFLHHIRANRKPDNTNAGNGRRIKFAEKLWDRIHQLDPIWNERKYAPIWMKDDGCEMLSETLVLVFWTATWHTTKYSWGDWLYFLFSHSIFTLNGKSWVHT